MDHKVGDLIYDDISKAVGVIKRIREDEENGMLYDVEWSSGESSTGIHGLASESIDYLKDLLNAQLKRMQSR
jgi:hypothetical protein